MVTESIEIRPSDVSAWSLCPQRVEFKDYQRIYPSYAMTRGSLMHARIEFELAKGHSFAWAAEYDDILVKDTDMTAEELDLSQRKVGELIGEAEAAFVEWKNVIAPLIEPYGDDIVVEHKLIRPLASDVNMGGTPDLVIPDEEWIIDWKTANAPWKDGKANGELQPPAYTWLNEWDQSKFTFMVFDFKSMTWAQHTVYVTKKQVDAWEDLAYSVATSIANNVYPGSPHGQGWQARGWHCSPKYCAGWNPCETKYLIADGKADDVRDPRLEWI